MGMGGESKSIGVAEEEAAPLGMGGESESGWKCEKLEELSWVRAERAGISGVRRR